MYERGRESRLPCLGRRRKEDAALSRAASTGVKQSEPVCAGSQRPHNLLQQDGARGTDIRFGGYEGTVTKNTESILTGCYLKLNFR